MSVYPEKCASSGEKDEEEDRNHGTNYSIIWLVIAASLEEVRCTLSSGRDCYAEKPAN